MSGLLPLARNIEEVSSLAQYFTLVAASRNHSAQKEEYATNITTASAPSDKKVEPITPPPEKLPKLEKKTTESSASSLDSNKGQNVDLLF